MNTDTTQKTKNFQRMPYVLSAAWFCLCIMLSLYISSLQNGLRLAPPIFYTIDDELRGLLPYCGLKHPLLLLHVNPRFLFGAVQAMLTNIYVRILHLDLLTAFRFTSALFSSLAVLFFFKTAQLLQLGRLSTVFGFLLLLTSPLFLFFSVTGFETVFCAFLVTLFFYLYLQEKKLAAGFILGLAPLVRLETLALCAFVALLCLKEKKLSAACLLLLPFIFFTAATKLFLGYETDKSVYDIILPANFPHRELKDIAYGYANLWTSYGDIFWLITLVSVFMLVKNGGLKRTFEKTFLLCAAAFLAFLTLSYFYSSVYSLCGRYWLTLLPAQCLFLASVWQNDMEPALKNKQKQNRWVMLFPYAIYIAYFYVMSIHRGLPPQNSDNQFARAELVMKPYQLDETRAWLGDYLKSRSVKTLELTWEIYDPQIFVENECGIFDRYRVLWGPTPEAWRYWTDKNSSSAKDCETPYPDYASMQTKSGLPQDTFLIVTTSNAYRRVCDLKTEKVFQDSGIKIYSGGLRK